MKLIDEWKQGWRMFSLQANAVGAAIVGAYTQLPEKFQAVIPSKWVLTAAGIVFVFGGLGRLVHQPSLKKPDGTPADEDPK